MGQSRLVAFSRFFRSLVGKIQLQLAYETMYIERLKALSYATKLITLFSLQLYIIIFWAVLWAT